MRRDSNDIQQLDIPLHTMQSRAFDLALEDAKRAMDEDLMFSQQDLAAFADENFTSQLYFHCEKWESFERQQFYKNHMLSEFAAGFLDSEH